MAALVTLSMDVMRSEKNVGVSVLGITDLCFVKTPCTHARNQRQRPVHEKSCLSAGHCLPPRACARSAQRSILDEGDLLLLKAAQDVCHGLR